MTVKEWFRKIFFIQKKAVPEKQKVFCTDCFYYLHTNGTGRLTKDGVYHMFDGLDVCAEPHRLRIRKNEDTAIRKSSGKIESVWYDKCEKFNSTNSCSLFRPKEDEKEDEKPSGTS